MTNSEPLTWNSNMYKLLFVLALLLSADAARAQSRALGASFSYSGIGITYEHDMDSQSFIDMQLRAETSSLFTYGSRPGISASFSWNMIFSSIDSKNGNIVRFYAGPGLAIGSAEDIKGVGGKFFGLKGRVGCECAFSRKVAISFSLSPVLGAHIKSEEGTMIMLPFKMGMLYGIMPEVGIKHVF